MDMVDFSFKNARKKTLVKENIRGSDFLYRRPLSFGVPGLPSLSSPK